MSRTRRRRPKKKKQKAKSNQMDTKCMYTRGLDLSNLIKVFIVKCSLPPFTYSWLRRGDNNSFNRDEKKKHPKRPNLMHISLFPFVRSFLFIFARDLFLFAYRVTPATVVRFALNSVRSLLSFASVALYAQLINIHVMQCGGRPRKAKWWGRENEQKPKRQMTISLIFLLSSSSLWFSVVVVFFCTWCGVISGIVTA